MKQKYEILNKDYIRTGCDLLKSVSVAPGDAETIMQSLLDADLRGVFTHGLFRLPRYIDQLKANNVNPCPQVKTVRSNSWLEVLDGDHGPGSVVANKAMQRALQKCRKNGIGVTTVYNGNHFGVAAYYAEMAAEEENIGLVLTNSSASIAPTGSLKRVVGNNPWAISAPTPTGNPLSLDIANSIVSRGKLRLSLKDGKKIPLGWALDIEGNPTEDPQKALEGIVLPIGDYKGYGIALMVEVIAGVLTGADFGERMVDHDVNRKRNVGHLFVALDINCFMSMENYNYRINELVQSIRNAPTIPGKRVYLPGEKEWQHKHEQPPGTVALPEKTVKSFLQLCSGYDIPIPKTQQTKK